MKKTLPIILMALFMSLLLAAQVSKIIICTPGGLYASMTRTELITVTDLTLTGTIDARDFVIMRDSMQSLASLDLSSVSIVAYSGNDGPAGAGSYSANAIPEAGFYYYPYTGSGKASLLSVTFPPTITAISINAFRGTGLTSLSIPATVTFIGDAAFDGCSGLTSINIPSSVTSIGSYAFADCIGSTSISISSLLNSIGSFAFMNSSGLITVNPGNPNYSSLEGVLYNNAKTQLIHCPTSKAGSLTIPSSVNSIIHSAFLGCTALTSVIIPSSVKTIEESAFMHCIGLKTVDIPSSVTTLGPGAFQLCFGLTSVTIPSSVTSIASVAFYYCTGLTSIYVKLVTPVDLTSSSNVFTGIDKTACTLYVPTGSKSAYQAANQWQDFINISEVITNVQTFSSNDINLYPNEVVDNFCVSGVEGMGLIKISDMNGKTLLSRQFRMYEKIAVNSLSRGLYIVKLILPTGVFERKMIKK